MEWTFHITADIRPRVLARLVQLFDQQSLSISSLTLTRNEKSIQIQLTVEVEFELANRLKAKLSHQLDIEHVLLESAVPVAPSSLSR